VDAEDAHEDNDAGVVEDADEDNDAGVVEDADEDNDAGDAEDADAMDVVEKQQAKDGDEDNEREEQSSEDAVPLRNKARRLASQAAKGKIAAQNIKTKTRKRSKRGVSGKSSRDEHVQPKSKASPPQIPESQAVVVLLSGNVSRADHSSSCTTHNFM
jgi:hypothetical protein